VHFIALWRHNGWRGGRSSFAGIYRMDGDSRDARLILVGAISAWELTLIRLPMKCLEYYSTINILS
jgi:hypothetical protein